MLFSKPFLSEGSPQEFVHVTFNDLDAMEQALSAGDAAERMMSFFVLYGSNPDLRADGKCKRHF